MFLMSLIMLVIGCIIGMIFGSIADFSAQREELEKAYRKGFHDGELYMNKEVISLLKGEKNE